MSEQFNKHLFHQQTKHKQLPLVIFNLAPKLFTDCPTPLTLTTAQLKGNLSLLRQYVSIRLTLEKHF